MSATQYKWIAAAALILLVAFYIVSKESRNGAVHLLTVNDVYRIGGVDEGARGGLARLAGLRRELESQYPELLVLHAGDFLFPSLLSRRYHGEQMVDALNALDAGPGFDERLLVTFGNHEFDKTKLADAPLLDRRVEESQFRWLGSNVIFKTGADGQPLVTAEQLVDTALVDSGGVRVGVFSHTIGSTHPDYVDAFTDAVATARRLSAELRGQGAELVIALTHQRMSEDVALLEALGEAGPDLIIGGHEHNRQCRVVDGRYIIKADADLRSVAVVQVTPRGGGPQGSGPPGSGPPEVAFHFRALEDAPVTGAPLDPRRHCAAAAVTAPPLHTAGPVTPEPGMQARVEGWLSRFDKEYCQDRQLPPGCLAEPLGRTRVTLEGEELEIRRFETNLGNWIADQALAAFAEQGAQIALLNAGGLRLNQDIPADTALARHHVDEILAYPTPLRLIRIDGKTLGQVLAHAVEDWTGNGWWLQISGLAYRHDPVAGTATHPTLITSDGPRPIGPNQSLLVVVNEFLLGGDGYTMLNAGQIVAGSPTDKDLRQELIESLKAAGEQGIIPEVEGRICNSQRPGPCRAVGQ